jgi:transcriptional regulator with XRE-family HTH domain
MDNEAFIERFKELLTDNNLSASALADEIDVQRSSISHILSGRNKPSLDFILKLVKKFPGINIYWLLNGAENKLKSNNTIKEEISTVEKTEEIKQELPFPINTISDGNKRIKHIVIFYEDATFDSYTPN